MTLLYLDPGTGSLLIQGLIAGFLAIFMFFKQIKFKIQSLLGKTEDSEEEAEN